MTSPVETQPELTIVPDDTPDEETVELGAEVTPSPPTPKAISIAQQIRNYATLAKEIRRSHQLNEGTIVRLIELALNERFTLMQMGLARPTTATEEPNGNESAAQDGE